MFGNKWSISLRPTSCDPREDHCEPRALTYQTNNTLNDPFLVWSPFRFLVIRLRIRNHLAPYDGRDVFECPQRFQSNLLSNWRKQKKCVTANGRNIILLWSVINETIIGGLNLQIDYFSSLKPLFQQIFIVAISSCSKGDCSIWSKLTRVRIYENRN